MTTLKNRLKRRKTPRMRRRSRRIWPREPSTPIYGIGQCRLPSVFAGSCRQRRPQSSNLKRLRHRLQLLLRPPV